MLVVVGLVSSSITSAVLMLMMMIMMDGFMELESYLYRLSGIFIYSCYSFIIDGRKKISVLSSKYFYIDVPNLVI